MAREDFDEAHRAFVEELKAGLAADDGSEYGWVDELPEDPGIPGDGAQVLIEVRGVVPRQTRLRRR